MQARPGITGYRVASLGLRHAASTALLFMRMTLAEVSEASCPWLNRRAGAGGLGVELAGEVFQTAVDLHGDHSVAGAEPAGDIQRGGEVRAGRGSGEDALVAGGPAGRRERPGFGDVDDFVVVGGPQLRWALADAAALDAVGPRWPAGQHRRFGGLDDGAMEPGQRGGQRAADAQEAACGADIAAEGADRRRPGELVEQFLAHPAIALDH